MEEIKIQEGCRAVIADSLFDKPGHGDGCDGNCGSCGNCNECLELFG